MKFIHLSDLHIGKRLKEFSLIEDQTYILQQILQITEKEKPDAVLLAGDIYDRSVPSAEGVELFDDFLIRLSKQGSAVFIISGNHDNPQRLAFGGRLMEHSRVYVSPVFRGKIEPVILTDSYGEVAVFMLPFIKPIHVRQAYEDETIDTYEKAVNRVIGDMDLRFHRRNILVAHQFVTGADTSDSEDIFVGDTSNISGDLFDPFDYVALGHLHKPQRAGKEEVRYCGSPLKYSFSEAFHTKSVTVMEMRKKGNTTIRTIPLTPLRDLREIRGSYMEVTGQTFYKSSNQEDYVHIILTDEEEEPNALGKLRAIYPNILRLSYDNKRTRNRQIVSTTRESIKNHPLEIIDDLYKLQNNRTMDSHQRAFAEKLIKEIWEEEE